MGKGWPVLTGKRLSQEATEGLGSSIDRYTEVLLDLSKDSHPSISRRQIFIDVYLPSFIVDDHEVGGLVPQDYQDRRPVRFGRTRGHAPDGGQGVRLDV